MEKRNFREDLFFRISTYTIEIPPLRERTKDIEEISKYYLKRNGFIIYERTMKFLKSYPFYGNVGELINILNRGMVEAKGNLIDFKKIDIFLIK